MPDTWWRRLPQKLHWARVTSAPTNLTPDSCRGTREGARSLGELVYPFVTEAERVSDLGQQAAGQMHAAQRVVEIRAGEDMTPAPAPGPQGHPAATGTRKGRSHVALINHRYPILGSVLSALSSVVFIALGIHTHHSGLVIFSVAGIALSVVQFIYRRRHGAADART